MVFEEEFEVHENWLRIIFDLFLTYFEFFTHDFVVLKILKLKSRSVLEFSAFLKHQKCRNGYFFQKFCFKRLIIKVNIISYVAHKI